MGRSAANAGPRGFALMEALPSERRGPEPFGPGPLRGQIARDYGSVAWTEMLQLAVSLPDRAGFTSAAAW